MTDTETPPAEAPSTACADDVDAKKRKPLATRNKAEATELALIEKRLSCEAEVKMKLLLVGSSLVGKTSLVSRFANSEADIETLKPTMMGDFHHFTVNFGGKCAHVRVWDMGGAEKFHQTDLVLDFYRDVDAVLLVFAMDNFESFQQLPVWLDRIGNHQARPLSQLDCCLVANKSDLSAKRLVSTREATLFANHHGLPFVETSALTGDNVQKAFYDLVLAVDRRRQTMVGSGTATLAGGGKSTGARRRRQPRFGDFRALCCGCAGRSGVPEHR